MLTSQNNNDVEDITASKKMKNSRESKYHPNANVTSRKTTKFSIPPNQRNIS